MTQDIQAIFYSERDIQKLVGMVESRGEDITAMLKVLNCLSQIRTKSKEKRYLNRILVMLINEAVDAVFLNIASPEDVDLAMTKGVNYPKGLLSWANELGLDNVLMHLDHLHQEYGEDQIPTFSFIKKNGERRKDIFLSSHTY